MTDGVVSHNIQDLTGVGLEFYIRPDGFVIEFLNGKFACNVKVTGSTTDTLIIEGKE